MQAGLQSQGSNILASHNFKHYQGEVVLQGQALCRSSSAGTWETKVTIRPLRLQENYSPGERIFGGFRLPLPQMRIKKHLRVLEGPLGTPLHARILEAHLPRTHLPFPRVEVPRIT